MVETQCPGDFWRERTAEGSNWERGRLWEQRRRQAVRARTRRRVRLLLAVGLGILVGATIARASGGPRVASSGPRYRTVVVHPGETLWSLAQRHGDAAERIEARVDTLVALNGGRLSRLAPGQIVRVPAP